MAIESNSSGQQPDKKNGANDSGEKVEGAHAESTDKSVKSTRARNVETSGTQVYELRPDWRIHLPAYVIGLLLVPLLGLGLWIIYRYRQKWLGIRYLVTNNGVIHQADGHETNIPLHEIISCEVRFTGLPSRFGLGTIHIRHINGIHDLAGIAEPEPVAVLIERAAESERERMKMREEIEKTRPQHPSGTLERKNELVGLWQQGLISEEDYQQELRKFE